MRSRTKDDEEKKMKKWEFLCPKEAFVEFAREYSNEFFPIDAQTVSLDRTNKFIDRFLEKKFTDYDPS